MGWMSAVTKERKQPRDDRGQLAKLGIPEIREWFQQPDQEFPEMNHEHNNTANLKGDDSTSVRNDHVWTHLVLKKVLHDHPWISVAIFSIRSTTSMQDRRESDKKDNDCAMRADTEREKNAMHLFRSGNTNTFQGKHITRIIDV